MPVAQRLSALLREWADALWPPRPFIPAGLSFTEERFKGKQVNGDGRGCPLYFHPDEYGKAHFEAYEPDPLAPWRQQQR